MAMGAVSRKLVERLLAAPVGALVSAEVGTGSTPGPLAAVSDRRRLG